MGKLAKIHPDLKIGKIGLDLEKLVNIRKNWPRLDEIRKSA